MPVTVAPRARRGGGTPKVFVWLVIVVAIGLIVFAVQNGGVASLFPGLAPSAPPSASR
jgi:hypothetical protein